MNKIVRSAFWPEPSAHRAYWERNNCPYVYEYEPADDGPEVDIARVILASHSTNALDEERFMSLMRLFEDGLL
jgi:hypothetical protein